MTESLADIEALALQCRSEQSRGYVAEAVLCYRAGAYRATIVNTWIAVVFDLIDKIRELALAGDGAAKGLEQQYETYLQQIDKGNSQGVKSALEFERDILTTCKNALQFFDQQQFIDLARLREDRHRCAHPSFQRVGLPYHPSAEQARLHLRNAVVHVLAQPPIQGKAALAQLKSLVSSSYFPTETEKAVTQLKNSALENPSDALIRGFIDQLLFGFFDQNSPLFAKRQVTAALSASLQMYRPTVEQRMAKDLNSIARDVSDKLFTGVVALVAVVDSCWGILELPARDKVIQFIRTGNGAEVVKWLSALSDIPQLQADVQGRVARLTFEELSDGIDAYRLGSLGKARALEFLSQSKSWIRTNEVINKTVLPLFEALDAADIERIIRFSVETGADIPGAASFEKLIDRVRQVGMFALEDLNRLLSENSARYLVPQLETT